MSTTNVLSHDGARDEAALERFRELLRIPTISRAEVGERDEAAFDAFAAAVERLYPGVHAALERELVDGRTLLYRWAGSASGGGSAPGRGSASDGTSAGGSASDSASDGGAGSAGGPATILMAHYDVVAATDEGWEHPPFAAELTGSGTGRLLWGRGTLDDKGSVVSILEAVERSLAAGLTPVNDVYLLFGHDEETAGTGAAAAARLLAERGVSIGLVLDEGGAVVEKVFPTVERPVAVVGVSEKGITNFTLTVEQAGGHASTPPKVTATARLARAIVRLSKTPFPSRLNAPTAALIRTVGVHGRGPLRALFTRVDHLKPVLRVLFARLGPETAAMVRTTVAVTQLSGSLAANALPERAQAVLNVRIAIGSSVAATKRRLERIIADPQVVVGLLEANEPSPISRLDGPVWQLLSDAVHHTYPEAIVTPYVQTGATDSRHFTPHSRTVYRFSPFEMSGEERATLHAKNERMHVQTWFTGIRFFEGLLRRL